MSDNPSDLMEKAVYKLLDAQDELRTAVAIIQTAGGMVKEQDKTVVKPVFNAPDVLAWLNFTYTGDNSLEPQTILHQMVEIYRTLHGSSRTAMTAGEYVSVLEYAYKWRSENNG